MAVGKKGLLVRAATAAIALEGLLAGRLDAGSISRTYVGGAGTGNWFTAGNWSPTGEPVQAEDVFVSANDSPNRTLMYNTFNPPPNGYGLMLVNNTGAGSGTLLNFSNTMKASLVSIGAHGTYQQQGLNSSSTFVSVNVNNNGRLMSAGGTFNVVDFTQLLGTVEGGPYTIGSAYRLQGGTLNNATVISNGQFDFTGGGASGFCTIVNNGTLALNNPGGTLAADIKNHGAIDFLQHGSVRSLENFASMTLPSNRNLTANDFVFGIQQDAGTFTMSGTSIVQTPAANISSSTWKQLGGTLNAQNLHVGGGGGVVGNGTYLISAGTANLPLAMAGIGSASGTVTQTGGAVIADRLWLGDQTLTTNTSRGTYNISAGSLTSDWEVIVGREGSAGGVLRQSGGYVRTNTLKINENGKSNGIVSISDGVFESNSFPTTNNGLIDQSGGRSYFNGIVGTGSVVLSGSASLTCASVTLDAVRLSGDAKMSASYQTNRVNLLTFDQSGGAVHGSWDLVDGSLVVNYADGAASPIAEIRKYLVSGYAHAQWDGAGLNTSAVNQPGAKIAALGYAEASDVLGASGGTFDGTPVDGSAVLVKYTYYGDANLDGRVTFDDYVRIDTAFHSGRTGWSNGDFNYDGAVNFDDYVLIDVSFNQQNGTLSRAVDWISGEDRSGSVRTATGVNTVVDHLQEFGVAYGRAFLAAVPEPCGALGALVLGAATLARRRRGNRQAVANTMSA